MQYTVFGKIVHEFNGRRPHANRAGSEYDSLKRIKGRLSHRGLSIYNWDKERKHWKKDEEEP